jgi:O-antigen/teichoic acid export membrane protein
MLKFGGKTYAQNMAAHMHYRADIYLIAAFLNHAEIAFYSIGAGLAERCLMIPDAMGVVLYPHLTSSSDQQGAQLTARACRNTLLLGVLTAGPICLFGYPLISVMYGQAYLPAIAPMYILMAGVVFIGLTRILMRYLTSINAHEHNAYIVAASAVANICLNLILIPRYGIVGAAFSSLCTYSIQGMWAIWLFTRFTGLSVRDVVLVTPADLRYLSQIPLKLRPKVVAPEATSQA